MDKGLQNFLIIFFVLAFVFVAAMMLGDSSIDIYEKKVLIVAFPYLLVPLMLFSFIISGVKSGKMLALPSGSGGSHTGFCILDISKGDSIWFDAILNSALVIALTAAIWELCVSDPWEFLFS
jgi:hypothetical protein